MSGADSALRHAHARAARARVRQNDPAHDADQNLGVYGVVAQAGDIKVGDTVELVA
jgi:hypothetical protein